MAHAALEDRSRADALHRAEPWAWGVCWLMFGSTTLCYMDRQAMSLVGTKVQAEFGIDDTGLGWVQAAFYLTYAVFQVPAGFLVDRGDVRKTYALAVGWWSLAGMAAAFSPTIGVLMALRALLGVGESFNWPCALKVTAKVLPASDRGLGNGIFNSGAAVGAVLTPLIVTPLAARYGWRTAFVVVGVLGLVWVALWLGLLGKQRASVFAGRQKGGEAGEDWPAPGPKAPLSSKAKGTLAALGIVSVGLVAATPWLGRPAIWWGIASAMIGLLVVARWLPEADLKGSGWLDSLGQVVRLRRFWVLTVMSISINVCWHFLVNWMAPYFQKGLDLKYLVGGLLSAIPFIAADAGNLGGGAVSRFLAGRGLAPAVARLRVVAFSALLILSAVGVATTKNPYVVIPLLSVAALGVAAYMANYFAYCQEVSERHTGLVVGYLGGLGNLFAAGFLVVAGWISDTTGGFGPTFVIVGLLPMAGLLALGLGWGGPEAETKAS